MDKFSLSNNREEIDFNLFKDKLKLSDMAGNQKIAQIFKLFDTDGNGILESTNSQGTNEIQSLLKGMSKYAANNKNSIFESNEVQQYLNETTDSEGNTLASKNISINDIFNFLKILKKTDSVILQEAESRDSGALTASELQNLAIQTLTTDSIRARELFDKQNNEQGYISDAVNWVKELFNTENAASNVDRLLMLDEFSNYLINRASSGDFTYKEYYEAKIEFIVQLVAKFDKTIDKVNLEKARNNLKNLTPECIDNIIQAIGTIRDTCAPERIPAVVSDIISMQFEAQNSYSTNTITSNRELPQGMLPKIEPETVSKMETSGRLDKIIEFEKVFELERGVKYNPEAINEYELLNAQLQILSGMNNNIATIETLKTQVLDDTNSANKCSESMSNNIMNYLNRLYGNDSEKIEAAISNILNISKEEAKSFPRSKTEAIKLLDGLNQKAKEVYNNTLNGKTFEDYSAEIGNAYKKAYGNSNITNIVNMYIQSQQEGVQTVKTGVQVAGTVVMIAGQCIPVGGQIATALIYGGMATATLGSTAISATENFTKAGGATEEDKKEMIKELSTAITLTATGMGIGKISESAFKMLILKNCPKLLAWASEVGIDATMSLVADAAITGEVNLSGEGMSQLTNILVGIIRSKGHLGTYINNHAGDITKLKSDNTTKLEFDSKDAEITSAENKPQQTSPKFGLQEAKQVSSKDSQLVTLLKNADLENEEVQTQVLKELETQFPSTKRIPGRIKTLKEFQKLVNSPEYANFDEAQKQIALLIILKSNPRIDERDLYDDLNLSMSEKQRVKNIESCLSANSDPTSAAALYKGNDIETALVMAKYMDGFDEAKIASMKSAYDKAQANGCLLVKQTHITTDNIPTEKIEADGKTYTLKVIDCSNPEVYKNPEQFGLESGTTADNIRLTVHMNDAINQNPRMSLGQMRARDNLNLSATVTNGKNSLYGDQQVGIVLDYDMGAISYASNYAAGTGFGKNIGDFANAKLNLDTPSQGTFVREQFIENMKAQGFDISIEDYASFSRQFQGKNLTTQDLNAISNNGMIEINGKNIPVETVKNALLKSTDDMINTSYEMRGSTVQNGFNEINIYQPEIKAIYVRRHSPDETLESILSPNLLDYIQQKNIPVIIQ